MAPVTPQLCVSQPIPPGAPPVPQPSPRQVQQGSLQLPGPCTRCCCLQLCPDRSKVTKSANKSCRFLLFGASSAAELLDSQRHTEMLQWLPRFLFILLKVYLMVQLVPVLSYACSWHQDKLFLLLGLLQPEHVTICFNFLCQVRSALQLQ